MAVKIKDLAELAGVSQATVSLALNGSGLVNGETRRRVLELAREHGYTPNSYARRLALRRSGMFGLIVPDIENVFYASLVRGINDCAQRAGYGLSIAISGNSPALEEKIVTEMISGRVEGVVCVPVNVPDGGGTRFARFADAGIPAVCSTTRVTDAALSSVMCGLTQYLLGKGYRRFAYVTGPAGVYTLDIRREGFLDAVRQYGEDRIEYTVSEFGEVTYSAACQAAESIAERSDMPDAVICVNDMMALGVVNTFSRRGIAVPDSVAVAGFDDVIFAQASPAPLTTVRQDIGGIARESVALLQKLTDGLPSAEAGDIVLPTELVVRQSTL